MPVRSLAAAPRGDRDIVQATAAIGMSRDDSWLRDKGLNEKWPRFAAEIPPELADELNAHAEHFRYQHGRLTRADMVRSALRLYLNAVSPVQPPAIEGTAEEIIDLPALQAASDENERDR